MKMGYFGTWITLLGIVFLIPLCYGCGVLENPLGSVSDDQSLEVGSRLVFQCSLFTETVQSYNITSKDLILKFKGNQLTEIRQLDDYTVEYVIPEAHLDHNGMYFCFAPIAQYEKPQLVCSSNFAVGSKPLEVSDFSCISVGFQNLTCSWKAPQNNVKTDYVLYDYLMNDERFGPRKCPVPDRRSSSCTYRLDTKPSYITNQPVLNFILNGTNDLGMVSQRFRINHYEIVKPAEPKLLFASNVSTTSLVLNIGPPKALENGEFKDGLIYSIKYYSTSTKLNITKEERIIRSGGVHVPISNLVPHTMYKFEVRVRLNITSEQYFWGDMRSVVEMTPNDVPYYAPVTENSAFDIEVIAGFRTISLYWKAVPSEFENGDDFHYIIKYHEHFVPSRYRRSTNNGAVISLSNRTSCNFKNMEVDTAYLFNIFAANSVGNSSNLTAIVVVDKNRNLLPRPQEVTVVSYNHGHYNISWNSIEDIQDFTLFWCQTIQSRPARCEGPIDWIHVRGHTQHTLKLQNTTNYQFAVSSRLERRTSGMSWADCTVLYGVVYSIPKIELMPKSTSLKVRWSLKCEAQKQVIQEYSIHYCAYRGACDRRHVDKCSSNAMGVLGWPSITIKNTTLTEYTLTGLKPFTCYFAYLRVKTDSGWGENSDYAHQSTQSSAPSDPPSALDATSFHNQPSLFTNIRLTFQPPSQPNGIITRYVILYNRTSSSTSGFATAPTSFKKEVWVHEMRTDEGIILQNLSFYSNYSIQVMACVDRACSGISEPVYVYTGISTPGMTSRPRIETLHKQLSITWTPPPYPNGPLDLYQVRVLSNETEEVYNVTDAQHLLYDYDCDNNLHDQTYIFQVRSLNVDEEGTVLPSDYSAAEKTLICPSSIMSKYGIMVAGIIGACIFGLLVIGFLVKWMGKFYRNANKTIIQLPNELESSPDNPLNFYDKFKEGLQNNYDNGIHEGFYHIDGDLKLDDEILKRKGPNGGRNLSGDSASSDKGQDSISSANTTKTNNSMDSGAEVESPPSPDSFCNSMPRHAGAVSKDSGLDKDGSNFNVQWFLKMPMPTSSETRGMSLANSEPSVAEFDVGDGTEPLVNPVIQPYSRFGLARSVSNGIDLSNNAPLKTGYSKFGTVYRPLKSIVPTIVPTMSHNVFMATSSFAPPVITRIPHGSNMGAYSVFGLSYQQDLAGRGTTGYTTIQKAVNDKLLVLDEREIMKPLEDLDVYFGEKEEDVPEPNLDEVPSDDVGFLEDFPSSDWNVSSVQHNGGRVVVNCPDSSTTSDNPSQMPVINCQELIDGMHQVLPASDSTVPSSKGDTLDDSSSSQGSELVAGDSCTFVDANKFPLSSIEIPQNLTFDFARDSNAPTSQELVIPQAGTGGCVVVNDLSDSNLNDKISNSDLAQEIREAFKDVNLEQPKSNEDILMVGFKSLPLIKEPALTAT